MEATRFNVSAPTNLLKVLGPKLKERGKQKPTGIIFVTSPVGCKSWIPYLATYSGDCAYLQVLARSFQKENPEIDVLYFNTKMNLILRPPENQNESTYDSRILFREIKKSPRAGFSIWDNIHDFVLVNSRGLFVRNLRDIVRGNPQKPQNDVL
jgi:hypothetical protein